MFCLYIASCKDKQDDLTPATSIDSSASIVEDAYPNRECVWKDGTFYGVPIRYGIINNESVFEGDIILTAEQTAPVTAGRISGAGTNEKILRWHNFTVPYTIDPGLPNQKRVIDAIAHWEQYTPIRFVKRTNQADYITFKKGDGCDSNIGRIGGQQFIRLASGCNTGNAIHEIGHAVGLLHEHTRSDRDNFITIHQNNIRPNDRDQFLKYTDDNTIAGFRYGNYDFNSIMHYHWNAFAIDENKPTISRKDGGGNLTFGQREVLSYTDRKTVVNMYSNLYIVYDDGFYAVCAKDGSFARLGEGWSGFTSSGIASSHEKMVAVHQGNLYRIDRYSGNRTLIGNNWGGVVAVAGNGGDVYAIQDNRLWRIKEDGTRIRLSNPSDSWSDTEAIFAHQGYLLIVRQNHLWKVNATTGLNEKELGNGWGGTKAIADIDGFSDVFILQGPSLWRVNPNTGTYAKLGPTQWDNVKGMVGVFGKLYIVNGSTLYQVDPNTGKRSTLSTGWGLTKSMGVYHNSYQDF